MVLPKQGQFIEYLLSTRDERPSSSGRQLDWAGIGNRQTAGGRSHGKNGKNWQSAEQAPLETWMSNQRASRNEGKGTGMLLPPIGPRSVRMNHWNRDAPTFWSSVSCLPPGRLLRQFRRRDSRRYPNSANPAGLCWSLDAMWAWWVQCEPDKPSWTLTQTWFQARMPDYSLNWTNSSTILAGQWSFASTQPKAEGRARWYLTNVLPDRRVWHKAFLGGARCKSVVQTRLAAPKIPRTPSEFP